MADTADVLKMKVADLKRELKLRGLMVTGNKTDLQERLQSSLLDGDLSLEDTAISEDLLDEDVLTDEEAESAALESPLDDEKCILSPESGLNLKLIDEPKTKKVVILKRKSSLTTSLSTSSEAIKTTAIGDISSVQSVIPPADKIKKIEYIASKPKTTESNGNTNLDDPTNDTKLKVSQLTMKERLEMRAKKFGIKENEISNIDLASGLNTKSKIEQSNDPKVIEALKKRAERFGCVVAPKIVEIEKAEKLQKRKERFGGASTNNGNTNNSTASSLSGNSIYAEKARLRLERFKTATK